MPLAPYKVTICGIAELGLHCGAGVSHVLSIIDTHEPKPMALDQYLGIDHELIRFDDIVAEYPGFEACTPQHIERVLLFGERAHKSPEGHVLVHCHAGVSRSTAAAAILMSQFAPGEEEAAFLKLLMPAIIGPRAASQLFMSAGDVVKCQPVMRTTREAQSGQTRVSPS